MTPIYFIRYGNQIYRKDEPFSGGSVIAITVDDKDAERICDLLNKEENSKATKKERE